jgi:cytochrome P450
MHNCLGMNLARLIVETYLNRLLDRMPDWVVTDDSGEGFRSTSYLPIARA